MNVQFEQTDQSAAVVAAAAIPEPSVQPDEHDGGPAVAEDAPAISEPGAQAEEPRRDADRDGELGAGIEAEPNEAPGEAPDAAEFGLNAPQEPDIPVHQACASLPRMTPDQLQNLAIKIRKVGLKHPIVMHNGQIVDGRHRYIACRMAGVEPEFVEWRDLDHKGQTLCEWILTENIDRRQHALTLDQITMLAVKVMVIEEREAARQRQIDAGRQQGAHGKRGGRKAKPLPVNSPEGVPESSPNLTANKRNRSGETRGKLARKIGTTTNKVRQAVKILEKNPKLMDAVIEGNVSLGSATKQVDADQGSARPAPAEPTTAAEPLKPGLKVGGAVAKVMLLVDTLLDEFTDHERELFIGDLIEMARMRRGR